MNTATTTQAHATTLAEYLQTIPSAALAAAVRGEVDALQLLREELASRGLDHQARWVGFDAANKLAAQRA